MRKIGNSKKSISCNTLESIISFYPMCRLALGVKPKSERNAEHVLSVSIFLSPFLLCPIFIASSLTWPGATNIIMPGSNHGQMKNDSKLKTILNNIYNGNIYGSWWTMPTR